MSWYFGKNYFPAKYWTRYFGPDAATGSVSLSPVSLSVGSPSIGSPPIGQSHNLVALDLAVGSPSIGEPILQVVSVANGDTVSVSVELIAGSASGIRNAVAGGQLVTVQASLVTEFEEGVSGGAPFAPRMDAVAYGKILVVQFAIYSGAATASAKAIGSIIPVGFARSTPGRASAVRLAHVDGTDVRTTIELLPGSARGEDNLSDEELLVLLEAA